MINNLNLFKIILLTFLTVLLFTSQTNAATNNLTIQSFKAKVALNNQQYDGYYELKIKYSCKKESKVRVSFNENGRKQTILGYCKNKGNIYYRVSSGNTSRSHLRWMCLKKPVVKMEVFTGKTKKSFIAGKFYCVNEARPVR